MFFKPPGIAPDASTKHVPSTTDGILDTDIPCPGRRSWDLARGPPGDRELPISSTCFMMAVVATIPITLLAVVRGFLYTPFTMPDLLAQTRRDSTTVDDRIRLDLVMNLDRNTDTLLAIVMAIEVFTLPNAPLATRSTTPMADDA